MRHSLSQMCGVIVIFVVVSAWSLPAQAVQRSFLNNGFETVYGTAAPVSFVNYCWVGQSTVPPWISSDPTLPNANCNAYGGPGTGNIIELWFNNFNGVPARAGKTHAELNANAAGTLTQNVCVLSNEDITWRLSHRARVGTDRMRYYVGAVATGLVLDASTTTAGATTINSCQTGTSVTTVTPCSRATTGTWGDYAGQFRWTGASGVTSINFAAFSTGSGNLTNGNFLDEVYFYLKPIVEFSAANGSGQESIAAPLTPRLRVVGQLINPLPVSITITGGTATLGQDYTTPNGLATFTVTIPAGNYDDTSMFATGITVIDDKLAEGDETIIMRVNADSAYIISSSSTCGSVSNNPVTYTIIDNDANVLLNKTTVGSTGTFNYTLTNVDTDLVTAGNQLTAGITTAAPGTPVGYDADSGTAGSQPIWVQAVGTNVTVSETVPAGWSVFGTCNVTGGSSPISGIAINSSGFATIPATNITAGSTTTCSYTNTKLPTVTLTKISNGGTGLFTFTGTNGWSSQNITTVTPEVGVAGVTQTLMAASTFTDIIESVPPAGFALTGINCSGLGSGLATYDLPNRKVTLDALATAAGNTIACTFTNSKLPTITKYFSPAAVGVNDSSTMTFTLGNSNAGVLTNASFTDTLTGFSVASTTIGGTCAAVSNAPALAVGATALNLNVPNLPAGGCTVTIAVKSAAAGSYPNTTSGVTTTETPVAGAVSNTATLSVFGTLLTKTFNPASITAGSTSTLTFTISNTGTNPAQNSLAFTDNMPFGLTLSGAPAPSQCNGTVSSTANSITFINGSLSDLSANCTIAATVTSGSGGIYTNNSSNISGESAGMDKSGVNATLTVIAGTTVSGTVYADSNHNGILDSTESGTGLTPYIKLISGSCSGTFSLAAAVAPASGTYSLPAVTAGTYCLLLSGNSNADSTAGAPLGWLGIEGAGGKLVNVTSTPLSDQNFGLYNGSRVVGNVFSDNGLSGGTANDGVKNGAESGLAGVSVKANSGATVYDSTTTNGGGDFVLWIPAMAGALKFTETNLPNYLSTGGSPGSYDRSNDTIAFTATAGSVYTGINFADVPDNRFQTDNTTTALPGTVVFYPHSFTAGSGGSVSFSSTAVASPPVPGWSEVFYRDSNCNGTFDGGEPQIVTPITLLANEQLCIFVKEFVPANAPIGASNLVTATAAFIYTAASPALSRSYVHSDTTTVGSASSAALTLTKAVDQAQALPGSNLIYTITYSNNSSGPLNNIIIHDSVPVFTSLSITPPNPCCVNPTTTCLGSAQTAFPNNISACAASTAGDAITWTLTGTLAPGSTGQVKFRVTVKP